MLYHLLLALGYSSLFFVENLYPFSLAVVNVIVDSHILEIKGLLYDLIAVDAVSAVSAVRLDVYSVIGLALDVPLSGVLRVVNVDIPLSIARCIEKLEHKPLVILRSYPCRTDAN